MLNFVRSRTQARATRPNTMGSKILYSPYLNLFTLLILPMLWLHSFYGTYHVIGV